MSAITARGIDINREQNETVLWAWCALHSSNIVLNILAQLKAVYLVFRGFFGHFVFRPGAVAGV